MSAKTYSNLEIIAMPYQQHKEMVKKLKSRLEQKKREVVELEISLRYVSDLSEGKEEEEEEPIPKVDMQTPDHSNRFQDVSQDEAITIILREAYPYEHHIRKIARLVVRNGWGNGRKTAKEITPSINATLAKGRREGKYKKVGRGLWKIDTHYATVAAGLVQNTGSIPSSQCS